MVVFYQIRNCHNDCNHKNQSCRQFHPTSFLAIHSRGAIIEPIARTTLRILLNLRSCMLACLGGPMGREMSRTPQVQTRRSGARRSRVASYALSWSKGEASDVGSIEQLGGRDVAHRDRPEGLQRTDYTIPHPQKTIVGGVGCAHKNSRHAWPRAAAAAPTGNGSWPRSRGVTRPPPPAG